MTENICPYLEFVESLRKTKDGAIVRDKKAVANKNYGP